MERGEQGGGAPSQEPAQDEPGDRQAHGGSSQQQGPPPAPQQGWPSWQQQPSQPGYQQPSQPAYPHPPYPPPGPPAYPPAPYPGWGQAPYGYVPAPYGYGYEQPRPAWPAPLSHSQAVKAPPDEHPKELPWRLAGWWSRVGAQLIDLLIVWAPAVVILTVLILLAARADDGSATETTFIAVAIVATFGVWAVHLFYAPLLMKRGGSHNGQTWGKQMCGIRVIRANGDPMRFSDAALRQIIFKSFGALVASTFVPLFPWILNYLWPTWDEQHRALHDLAANTRVVAA